MRQAPDASSCTQGTPAGLPSGMPGIGLLMDGAMQQAEQPGRHAMPCPASADAPDAVEITIAAV
jgi:hypothetical protein